MESNEGRGWVKPVSDDSEAAQMEPFAPARPARRSFLVGGLILTVVIAIAIAGSVIWRGLNGDPFGSARSIPADMDYVVSFDVLALSDSERLQSFVDAFSVPMLEAGLIDEQPGDLVGAIDRVLGEETDFTLTDDILPWIGRSISIAGKVPTIPDPLSSFYDFQPSLLLSADVRDRAAAQAFVDKARSSLGNDGVPVNEVMIGGLRGYRIGGTDEIVTGALVLTDGALLVGIEEDVIAAIDARESGSSMAADATYLETMTLLPSDQMLSFYVSGRILDGLADLAALGARGVPDVPQFGGETPSVSSFGGSVGLVDEGLLVSYVMVGEDATESVGPDLTVLEALPADTLGFISFAGAATADRTALDRSVFDGLGLPLEPFEAEFGVDIIALLESLSGDFTAAAVETRDSSIARATDVPVGVVGALGLVDSGPMNEVIATLAEQLRVSGLSLAVDGAVSSVVDRGEELVSYSLQDELLVVGTGAGLVGDIVAGENAGVVASDVYRELDDAVSGDGLIVFVDIGRILRLIPMTSDEAAVLAPLRGMGVGTRSESGAIVVEALLLVDY